jgi:hypothetical protein
MEIEIEKGKSHRRWLFFFGENTGVWNRAAA